MWQKDCLPKEGAEFALGDNRYDAQNRGLRISWDDNRLFYKIPQNEELNNPNLKK